MSFDTVTSPNLPLANKRQGKVRDLYDITLPDGGDGVLIIASDRVACLMWCWWQHPRQGQAAHFHLHLLV